MIFLQDAWKISDILHSLPASSLCGKPLITRWYWDRLTSEADVVVHLAAAVGVKLIVEDPVRTIQTNIMGTEAVLSTANRYGCKVLIASSSEVYGKGLKVPFHEDDDCLIGPHNTQPLGLRHF